MIDRSPSPDELNSLFAQLNPLDVEQFYTAYQLWNVQQRIQTQQALIDAIQRDIAENATYLEQTHPSALALATLAHLQTKGVSDITILDRMLERGEEWLDRTMQHLDYCENIDMISGDYTRWCENALEGAYDWIDSMADQETVEVTPGEMPSSIEAVNGATTSITRGETDEDSIDGTSSDESIEELFLQKLMSEDTETTENWVNTENAENAENAAMAENEEAIREDEVSMLETTLKISAVSPLPVEDVPPEATAADAIAPSAGPVEDSDSVSDVMSETETMNDALIVPSIPAELPPEQETRPDAVEPTPVLEETHTTHTEETSIAAEESAEHQPPLMHEEAKAEGITQPATAIEAQEATLINKPQTESVVEQEVETPVVTAPVDTARNDIAPSTLSGEKPERGFWRTLIAVLFHV